MSTMDAYLDERHSELNLDYPLMPFGLENELMEILWQNGEAVLQSQTNRKLDSMLWMYDSSFNSEDLLMEPQKLSDVEEVFRFPSFNPIQMPIRGREQGFVTAESSVMTTELSGGQMGHEHGLVSEMDENSCTKTKAIARNDSVEKEMARMDSSFIGSASNDKARNKRKKRDVEESEYPSEASEMESPRGNTSLPPKSFRRNRVAEVHNLSERKRRDRINEKMRALQELLPHSRKSDKASMLDDAIEYMKSLQIQLQWWMANGMAQMRILQHLYNSGVGVKQLPTLPSMQNLMFLPKPPLFGQAMNLNLNPNQPGFVMSHFSFQNQMLPNPEFLGFHFAANAQSMNAVNFSSHEALQTQNAKVQTNQ